MFISTAQNNYNNNSRYHLLSFFNVSTITMYLGYIILIDVSWLMRQTLFLVEETEDYIADEHKSIYLAKYLALLTSVFVVQRKLHLSNSLSCTSFGHGMG